QRCSSACYNRYCDSRSQFRCFVNCYTAAIFNREKVYATLVSAVFTLTGGSEPRHRGRQRAGLAAAGAVATGWRADFRPWLTGFRHSVYGPVRPAGVGGAAARAAPAAVFWLYLLPGYLPDHPDGFKPPVETTAGGRAG